MPWWPHIHRKPYNSIWRTRYPPHACEPLEACRTLSIPASHPVRHAFCSIHCLSSKDLNLDLVISFYYSRNKYSSHFVSFLANASRHIGGCKRSKRIRGISNSNRLYTLIRMGLYPNLNQILNSIFHLIEPIRAARIVWNEWKWKRRHFRPNYCHFIAPRHFVVPTTKGKIETRFRNQESIVIMKPQNCFFFQFASICALTVNIFIVIATDHDNQSSNKVLALLDYFTSSMGLMGFFNDDVVVS